MSEIQKWMRREHNTHICLPMAFWGLSRGPSMTFVAHCHAIEAALSDDAVRFRPLLILSPEIVITWLIFSIITDLMIFCIIIAVFTGVMRSDAPWSARHVQLCQGTPQPKKLTPHNFALSYPTSLEFRYLTSLMFNQSIAHHFMRWNQGFKVGQFSGTHKEMPCP